MSEPTYVYSCSVCGATKSSQLGWCPKDSTHLHSATVAVRVPSTERPTLPMRSSAAYPPSVCKRARWIDHSAYPGNTFAEFKVGPDFCELYEDKKPLRIEWDAGHAEILELLDVAPQPKSVERKLTPGWERLREPGAAPSFAENRNESWGGSWGCTFRHVGYVPALFARGPFHGACEAHALAAGVFAFEVICEAWCGKQYSSKGVPVEWSGPHKLPFGVPRTNGAPFPAYCTQACLDRAQGKAKVDDKCEPRAPLGGCGKDRTSRPDGFTHDGSTGVIVRNGFWFCRKHDPGAKGKDLPATDKTAAVTERAAHAGTEHRQGPPVSSPALSPTVSCNGRCMKPIGANSWSVCLECGEKAKVEVEEAKKRQAISIAETICRDSTIAGVWFGCAPRCHAARRHVDEPAKYAPKDWKVPEMIGGDVGHSLVYQMTTNRARGIVERALAHHVPASRRWER